MPTKTAKDGKAATVKVTPANDHELDSIRREFKFYSPAYRSFEKTALPRVGEKWEQVRTLPSGSNFLRRDTPFIIDAVQYLIFKLFGTLPSDDFDERPYLRDLKKFRSEDPKRRIQSWDTLSLAWHPTKPLLATAGVGNMPRIWDIETGECLTKRVLWHTASPAEMVIWSPDGEFVLSGLDVVDGTGKYIPDSSDLLWNYFRYSVQQYSSLRWYSTGGRGTSHLSGTNNFTPWRPFREQLVFENFEKNLVLYNRRTGAIEQVIDCDVGSAIVDFAWHPKGRFIAIAFEHHNIRVLDLDQLKIIDDLSVRRLIGWSPDGRILVARKEEPNQFVCWYALETREQPLPDEVKNELWFRRFATNMSADGLRFVRFDWDDKTGKSVNICSVSSGVVLASLPTDITTAAWSSFDGGMLATCASSETTVWRV